MHKNLEGFCHFVRQYAVVSRNFLKIEASRVD